MSLVMVHKLTFNCGCPARPAPEVPWLATWDRCVPPLQKANLMYGPRRAEDKGKQSCTKESSVVRYLPSSHGLLRNCFYKEEV